MADYVKEIKQLIFNLGSVLDIGEFQSILVISASFIDDTCYPLLPASPPGELPLPTPSHLSDGPKQENVFMML